MVNFLKIYTDLNSALKNEAAARQIAETLTFVYEDLQKTVTKEDFRELKSTVQDLVEAQTRTEHHVEELAVAQRRTEHRVEELADAQKRTEQRVEELADAQKRTEQRVEELADAQKRTEQRVEELAEAQKRTEQRVEELADAQKRTEEEIRGLAREVKQTNEKFGSLEMDAGYNLENLSYSRLPKMLKRDFDLEIQSKMKRCYVKDKFGNNLEVNIYGEGVRHGQPLVVIGESKRQLSPKYVDEFMYKRVQRFDGVFPSIFPVLITHQVDDPNTETYAKNKGIALYYSYEFYE